MMTATVCPSAEQLRAFSLGQLAEKESDELFEHLQDCETCKSELETVSDNEDSLIASLRQPDALPDLSDEPDCRLAVAKALGALAAGCDSRTTADLSFLPEKIGEYELVRPLGRGGMGTVYLARHTKLGREVALKVLATHRLADQRMRERFEAEMRAVGRLSHPHIVTAHDARELGDTAVLVTEYIDGFDLAELAARVDSIGLADACEMIRLVALALQYTSDQGFVHRDVKPSNIMLSRDGEVKLLDLGLARLQSAAGEGIEITATGQAMGTADFIAPEQVSDSRSVDVRADIYSLGCTLFKLLTGVAPFAGEQHATAFAKMTAHVSSDPPSLASHRPDAPPRLVKLVDSMLSKDPEARPQTPRAVAEKLSPFAKGADLVGLAARAAASQPSAAPSSDPSAASRSSHARPLPFLRRRVPMAAAIGGGLLGLILGLCLGVVIKIKYPDGTEIAAEAPSGSEISIEPSAQAAEEATEADAARRNNATAAAPRQNGLDAGDGNGDPSQPPAPVTPSPPLPLEPSAPLQFAVMSESEANDVANELLEAKIPDRQEESPGATSSATATVEPIVTDEGILYRIEDELQAAAERTFQGQRYALVSRKPGERISWTEIRGHIVRGMSNGRIVTLEFDNALTQRVLEITTNNVNRRLAIIIDNRIVAAPTIFGPIGNRIQLMGLSSAEGWYVMQLVEGGLVAPLAYGAYEGAYEAEQAARGAVAARLGTERVKAAKSDRIERNLKDIGGAFHNFHDTYHKLPGSSNQLEGLHGVPADKRIYPFSWRVAILPFVAQNELYEQYRFDEPWDSEANLQLLDKMPGVYYDPFAPEDQPKGNTNFQGFATGNSALGKEDGVPFVELRDGLSNTVLLIETKESVPWTKPQDLEEDPTFFDDHATHILMADGSVHAAENIDMDELHKRITRDGREPVDRNW